MKYILFIMMLLLLSGCNIFDNKEASKKNFDKIFTELNNTYIAQYENNCTNDGDTPPENLMSNIIEIYSNFNVLFPEVKPIIYFHHVIIMKMESDLSNVQSSNKTGDIGICQVNYYTYKRCITNFMEDVANHEALYSNYVYVDRLMLNMKNLSELEFNITFSLWFCQQLYTYDQGNTRNLISEYNSGMSAYNPRIPFITKVYLMKYDWYMALNLPAMITLGN